MKILAKKYPGNLYTVIHSGGFVALQLPEFDCLAKLEALGLSEDEAIDVLYAKAVPHEWRSLFGQATAAQAVAATDTLESVASEDDVQAVRQQQAELAGAVIELRTELASDRLEQERRDLESYLDAEAQRYRDALTANRQKLTRFAENLIWEQLWATPQGIRLQELRAA